MNEIINYYESRIQQLLGTMYSPDVNKDEIESIEKELDILVKQLSTYTKTVNETKDVEHSMEMRLKREEIDNLKKEIEDLKSRLEVERTANANDKQFKLDKLAVLAGIGSTIGAMIIHVVEVRMVTEHQKTGIITGKIFNGILKITPFKR